MIELSILLICLLVSVFVITYKLARFEWLDKIAGLIIITLPFERIPSLDTPIGTLKIGYALLGFGILTLFVLLLKKDPKLLALKLHPKSIWFLLFFVFSIPSWFFVKDFNRFLSTIIATIISFSVAVYVANFTKNIWSKFKVLNLVFILVGVFSIYQFIGDFIGLPLEFTGIRLIHSKLTNGSPRIPGTFNEPSYYANALILMFTSFLFIFLFEKNIFDTLFSKQKSFAKQFLQKNYQKINLILILIFPILFFLTIAKSAFVVIPFSAVLIVFYAFRFQKYRHIKFFASLGVLGFVLGGILVLFSPTLQDSIVQTAVLQISSTVDGTSGTSIERSSYLKNAIVLLPPTVITGIGSGQFGTYAENYIKADVFWIDSTKEIIVFNVYAEVLLEFGLVPMLIFLFIFINTIKDNFSKINRTNTDELKIMRTVLGIYLVSSLIQWNFISPIYINPIFISLGMILNLDQYEDKI